MGRLNEKYRTFKRKIQTIGVIDEKLDRVEEALNSLDLRMSNQEALHKDITHEFNLTTEEAMHNFQNPHLAALYAYRFLLNREPETVDIVRNNENGWQELRKEITLSNEYKATHLIAYPFCGDVYSVNKLIEKLIAGGEPVYAFYEDYLERSYRKIIDPDDTVVDIGAHKGRHSDVFYDLVCKSGGGKLIAFEPQPDQFALLEEKY